MAWIKRCINPFCRRELVDEKIICTRCRKKYHIKGTTIGSIVAALALAGIKVYLDSRGNGSDDSFDA